MDKVVIGEHDTELGDDFDSVWVGVGPLYSVYIRRAGPDLIVEVLARGLEDCNPIAECTAVASDAEAMMKEVDSDA
jgi:hypothetical protein